MAQQTVYVELLDEGVQVWRPVNADDLGNGTYRLAAPSNYSPGDEAWAFPPGSIVRCKIRQLSDGPTLVAVELVG